MRFYFYQTPGLLKWVYKPCTWRKVTDRKVLYLTFDDGPVPIATPFVLDTLKAYRAKATFFVVGDNVRKHPEIFQSVISQGHSIGNHTYNHLKGWNTVDEQYFANVEQCQQTIEKYGYFREQPIMRPPYGRIKPAQLRSLSEKYEIVMWQILSGDFDLALNHRSAWSTLSKANNGDIIVFHDSQKYLPNVQQLLPKMLSHFSEKGYVFESL